MRGLGVMPAQSASVDWVMSNGRGRSAQYIALPDLISGSVKKLSFLFSPQDNQDEKKAVS
jgi:hypothetical protein